MKAPFSWFVAFLAGVAVLAGYFLAAYIPILGQIQALLLKWASLLMALALLAGVLNLLQVHWHRVRVQGEHINSLYSFFTILSFLVTIGILVWFKPTGKWSRWIFDYVQVPIETSLMALVAIALIYSAIRMFSRGVDVKKIIFLAVVLVVLFSAAPIYGSQTALMQKLTFIQKGHNLLTDFSTWLTQVWATAGARGILLGVALGTVAAGLRVILGADRPYGG